LISVSASEVPVGVAPTHPQAYYELIIVVCWHFNEMWLPAYRDDFYVM